MRRPKPRWLRGVVLLSSLALWQTLALGTLTEIDSESEPEFVPAQIILKLKEGEDPASLRSLHQRYPVLSAERVFPTVPSPEERLQILRGKLRELAPGHQSWYWWADRDSPESRDYQARVDAQRERLHQQIKGLEKLVERQNRRRQAAPQVGKTPALDRTYLLKMAEGADLSSAIAAYRSHPAVEYAEPNVLVRVQTTTNDTYLDPERDGIWSTGAWGQPFEDLWGLKKIRADQAWDVSQGAGAVVAVIDTGMDTNHPDLSPNVWINIGEIPGNGIDDDSNGYVDDARGWDFVTLDGTPPDNDPMDDHGHGTHVAGTIAAVGNNRLGIVGVAPQARAMALKGMDGSGKGSMADICVAIVYAADQGADLINASWGGSGETPQILLDAVTYAHDARDVVFVAASGNSNQEVGSPAFGFFPANLRDAVAVSAFDSADAKASFSNFGPKIDVGAPGGGDTQPTAAYQPLRSILSLKAASAGSSMTGSGQLVVGTGYLRQAGTSMAAPHVAGVAALIRSLHPEFSAEQVRQALRAGSDDVGPTGFDLEAGYGRLNGLGALGEGSPLAVQLTQPAEEVIRSSQTVSVMGTVGGEGLADWRLEYGLGDFPTSWNPIAAGTAPITEAVLADWNLQSVPDGTYTVRVSARNNSGGSYEDRLRLKIDRVFITDPMPTEISIFRGASSVVVQGTVNPPSFQSYSIRIMKRDSSELLPAAVTLTGGGLQPVVDGPLGTWDTTGVPADQYRIWLEVALTTGPPIIEEVGIGVDPTLHPGWPQSLGDSASFFGPTRPIANHLTAADVNRDGKVDLVVGYGNSMRIYDHSGAMLPGWPQPLDPSDPEAFTISGAAVADLDGDGSPEIVAGLRDPFKVVVWHGDGAPMGGGWPRQVLWSVDGITVEDLNGDGSPESIATSLDGAVQVLDGQGASRPGWPATLDAALQSRLLSPAAVGDMDGDGRKELVVVNQATPTNLYVLRFDGTVMPGWPQVINPTAPDASFFPSYPALGDLDGDGDLEAVIGSWDGKVLAFHHDGTVVSGWPQPTRDSKRVNSPVIGDIDGDGRPEVIAGTDSRFSEGLLYAWHGDGRLLSGWPVSTGPVNFDFDFQIPVLADLDGDGKAEAICSGGVDTAAPFAVHAYRADGSEVAGFPKPTATIGAGRANSPAVADLDGDGLLELAWVDFNRSLYLWDLEAPADALTPWPMFMHDARHTGFSPPMAIHHPWANGQSVLVDEDGSVGVTLTATDPDNDPLTYTVIIQPTQGTLTGRAPDLTYTPAPNYHGPDSFTFQVTDSGGLASNVATVTIAVNPVNDPPAVDAQAVSTAENHAVQIPLGAVVDADGEAVTYTIGTPTHGQAGILGDLTGNGRISGLDATRVSQHVAGLRTLTAFELLLADVDGDGQVTEADVVEIQEFVSGSRSRFSGGSSAGLVAIYLPDPDFAGGDAFTVTATDGIVTAGPALVSITVFLYGDSDGDGDSDVTDALWLVRISLGRDPDPGSVWLDVDGDGDRDVTDALYIVSKWLGRILKFPAEP